jgi:hypothetical protein
MIVLPTKRKSIIPIFLIKRLIPVGNVINLKGATQDIILFHVISILLCAGNHGIEEHVPAGQSNDRDEPPGEEANYDMEMLGLKGSTGDDIGTTNMEHKECGDRDDRAHYEVKLMLDR